MRLDRRAARHEREQPVEHRGAPPPRVLVELLRELVGEPREILRPEERGDRSQEDRAAAESFEGEAEARELGVDALEGPEARRGQLERLREQELLRRQRAALEVAAQALEEDPLVRDVLVDEEDLVGGVRHDEGVLDLADDPAEERLAPVARLALAEERGLRRVAPRPAGRVRRAGRTGPRHERSARARLVTRDARDQARGRRVHLAEGRPDGVEHDAVEHPRAAEPHPRLGGMDVDVDLARVQHELEGGQGELVPRQERPVCLQQGLREERVPDHAAVDDEVDVVAMGPGERRRRGHPGDARPRPLARHVEEPRPEPEAVQGADPLPEAGAGRRVQEHAPVREEANVDPGVGQRQLGHDANDGRLLRGGALQELGPRRRVEEQVPHLDGRAGGRVGGTGLLHHPALARR